MLHGSVIFSMSVSLDGYIAGPDGDFAWSAPDDALHRFHNQQVAELRAHLLGRRLYETMVYWETADQDPALSDTGREFAEIWKALPKVVFSRTLGSVEGDNTRLARDDVATELARLRDELGDGEIAVGGAGLASECTRLGLIDEYDLFVCPVVVGGGTPFFPRLERPIALELLQTRRFGRDVLYLRYARRDG